MVRMILLSVFVMTLLSSWLFAQRQNGAIDGTVQDMDGQPIPGATITVRSPALIGGSSNAFTDQNGYYRFPVLAPGVYEVKAELQGFQTLTRRGIGVSVGLTLTVNFSLEMTTLSEFVEVAEKPPLIDVSTTAISFTVPPEIVQNLPKIQNVQFLMALTPGVGDDLTAYGASEWSNSIWVDGVNVSSPRAGNLYAEYNYNWIDEVQVTGIGAPAEYGGFTGVVGNFITRSGSNQFHGLFETFFQNQNLVDTNTPDPGPDVPFKSYDISAQLGGPILRDKLWFFSGIQYPYTETRPFGYDGVTTEKYTKFITKLTYKLNQNNTLQGFAHWNDHSIEGEGGGAFVLPEATLTTKTLESTWNATWISLLSSQTTFEWRFGGFYAHLKDIEDNPDLPSHFDGGTGIYSVNTTYRDDIKRFLPQLNAALSHHARDFIHGSHDFRFGIEFERSNAFTDERYNGGIYYYDLYGEPYYRYLNTGYIFDGSNHRTSAYAQDEWNITDRLSLSLGVRWDHNRGANDRGVVFKTDPVAPRIGLVWMLNKKNQAVIKAHYGDYYDPLLERLYFFLSDRTPTIIVEVYDKGTGQWEEVVTIHEVGIPSAEIKQPFVRQFTVGLDQVLPGEIPFGAHYIYKKWGNILEDIGLSTYEAVPFVNPLTGETINVFNRVGDDSEFQYLYTNPPGLYRRYDGVEFFANKQFSSRFSLSGSFVYSKITGNIPNDNRIGATRYLDDPNSSINSTGRLVNDPTIAWKIVGTYALPWGINTGWYFRHQSGDTWATLVRVGDLNQGAVNILGEPLGSHRFPSQNLLDMRVEKQFPLYGGQLRFTIDVFNVFNSSYVLSVENRFERPNYGMPTGYNASRQILLGVRYTF